MDVIANMEVINRFLWSVPVLLMIIGTGIVIMILCAFPQIRFFGRALRNFVGQLAGKGVQQGTSSYRALCTALAATVGTGNIAGVAGAIAIGGPGAIFWMWVSGFLGMSIKFAECTLAVHYRLKDHQGGYLGGPMYMIRQGMDHRWHFLGYLYAFFGIAAAFGVGNATQVNAVISAVGEFASQMGFAQSRKGTIGFGILLAVFVILMVSGGANGIGRTAEALVPLVSGIYTILCIVAIVMHLDQVPGAVYAVIRGAFSPQAVTGGVVGSLPAVIRIGVSRGVFTNEAGMGTASIAHAGADVNHPVEQGMMGIMEVFIDTIVICTMTALVILTSGIRIPYGAQAGAELTARALSVSFGPAASALLCGCLCCFAFATILGWGLYAGRFVEYLFGRINWKIFAVCQGVVVMLGAVLDLGLIWTMSELINGLMAVPNLVALLFLSPQLVRLTEQWEHQNLGMESCGKV